MRRLRMFSLSLTGLAALILFSFLILEKLPVAHQFCPYAAVCFGAGVFSGGQLVFGTAVIIGLLIAVSSIFGGRWFCGYVCPLGTLQELSRKVNPVKKSNRLPFSLHRMLSGAKYLVFLFTLVTAALFVSYLYMQFCPVLAIAHPQSATLVGIIFLSLVFLLCIAVERFFCRYLCPYAALMNIFIKFGKILKIKKPHVTRNLEVCIDCGKCSRLCPMQISVDTVEKVEDTNCLLCRNCLDNCPKDKCLQIHNTR